jgi:hypothetical protein
MLDLWTRIQIAKTHYQMGALTKPEFIAALGRLYEEAKA